MDWFLNWTITIDGRDASTVMRPRLLDITVSDRDGTASDTCQLTFDDTGGQTLLPRDGARLAAAYAGIPVFEGTVDSVRSSGSRGGMRTLAVGAKGFDAGGAVKTGQRWHMDDATLEDALARAAKLAGLSGIRVDPALGAIQRDYWSPKGETFLGWGRKLAREMGATFKIRGDQAVFAKRGSGQNASGLALPTVIARVGDNVISWDIAPVANRARFGTARVRYFDRASATFKEKDVQIEGASGISAQEVVMTTAADETQAEAIAQGRKAEAERGGGEGTVEIDADPTARAEGTMVLVGARPGIDGTYRISGVTLRDGRNSRATTSLEIRQPQGEAGRDTRQAG